MADMSRYCVGEVPLSHGYLLELELSTLSVLRHPVLPLPLKKAENLSAAHVQKYPQSALVDSCTGVISALRRFEHHSSIPPRLVSMHAHVSNINKLGEWHTDRVTAGTSFADADLARRPAIGEAVERYSGSLIQANLLRESSWLQITADHELALDPQDLVLFSDRQYDAPGFPFVRFERDLKVHWVRGRSVTRDTPAWLPASLCYGNWYLGQYKDSPPLANTYFAGLAAGPSLESAIVSALQEIVERHITMIWWANRHPLPSVRSFPPELAGIWSGKPEVAEQRAWLIPLPNEFGIPVMAGFVEHSREKILTAGFAARSDPREAALKAWAEALTLQDGARNLDRPDGGYRQAMRRGEVGGSFIKPWRADRLYLDDYRPDFRDAVDLMCQLQIHLDPRAADQVRPWADTLATTSLDDVPALPGSSLQDYVSVIEREGYEIFYADLTTPDVALCGMYVVRVMVPGLVCNFSSAFPYQGRGKLRRAAVELGWRGGALDEDEINLFPLPHA
jgi:ribosomal protein S12 methylthiotransferase accessory factor